MRNRPLSVAVAALVTLVASFIVYQLDIPNPVILLVVVMIAFTAMANNAAGIASGVCIVLYALFFFSDGHSLVHFSAENAYRCGIIVVSLVLIYLLTAAIRKRRDDALAQLLNLNEQLERQNVDLRNESDHDPLTGLYNRRGGDARVEKLLDGGKGGGSGDGLLAMLIAFDIDDFKEINDLYGHNAGDEALQDFAACLEREFSERAVLIRYGGDEFHVFAYGDSLSALEAKVRGFSKRTFSFAYQGHEVSFYVSCGYAAYPSQAETEKELYRKADAALYFVKMSGKHKAMAYSEEIDPLSYGGQQLSMHGVAENLPVAFMVYRADDDERVLIVSNSLLKLCEYRDYEEFMERTGGTFRGFVHPDDVERVERSITEQIRVNPNKMDTVDYRIVTGSGKVLQIRDIGRVVEDPNLGRLFYVIVYDRASLEAAAIGD